MIFKVDFCQKNRYIKLSQINSREKMKKILLLCLLLSGCVQYEQNPAPVSDINASPVIEEVKVLPPASESIPLTPFPGNITTQYIESQEQYNNANIDGQMIIINDNSQNVNQNDVPLLTNVPPKNTAPAGSFNNPIKFDYSKIYNPSKKKNDIEVVPGVEINKPANL